eukprot:900312-Rhodomonas_salina.1
MRAGVSLMTLLVRGVVGGRDLELVDQGVAELLPIVGVEDGRAPEVHEHGNEGLDDALGRGTLDLAEPDEAAEVVLDDEESGFLRLCAPAQNPRVFVMSCATQHVMWHTTQNLRGSAGFLAPLDLET